MRKWLASVCLPSWCAATVEGCPQPTLTCILHVTKPKGPQTAKSTWNVACPGAQDAAQGAGRLAGVVSLLWSESGSRAARAWHGYRTALVRSTPKAGGMLVSVCMTLGDDEQAPRRRLERWFAACAVSSVASGGGGDGGGNGGERRRPRGAYRAAIDWISARTSRYEQIRISEEVRLKATHPGVAPPHINHARSSLARACIVWSCVQSQHLRCMIVVTAVSTR